MLTYLAKRPLASLGVGLAGAALLVAGIITYPTPQTQVAQAQQSCSYTPTNKEDVRYPDLESNDWATTWKARKWLQYKASSGGQGFPIGVFEWQVGGRIKIDEQVSCFRETWKIKRAVLGSTRRGNRGTVINGSSIENDNNSFLKAVNVDYMQNNGTSPKDKDGAISGSENTAWDPVGLYGILSDNKDNLSDSMTFYPVEWTVTGVRD